MVLQNPLKNLKGGVLEDGSRVYQGEHYMSDLAFPENTLTSSTTMYCSSFWHEVYMFEQYFIERALLRELLEASSARVFSLFPCQPFPEVFRFATQPAQCVAKT